MSGTPTCGSEQEWQAMWICMIVRTSSRVAFCFSSVSRCVCRVVGAVALSHVQRSDFSLVRVCICRGQCL